MFTQIKTSKKNREVVTILSRKFNLGAENVIARIAFAYSLSTGRKLSLSDIADSQGKEYSKTVLFGSNYSFYLGLICVHYGLYKTDKDIPKYIKMHIEMCIEMCIEMQIKMYIEMRIKMYIKMHIKMYIEMHTI